MSGASVEERVLGGIGVVWGCAECLLSLFFRLSLKEVSLLFLFCDTGYKKSTIYGHSFSDVGAGE